MADTTFVQRDCLLCGTLFDERDTGSLRCYMHPKSRDMGTLHYPCCGASDAEDACVTHAAASRAYPYGCHRCDHFGTHDEIIRARTIRPYVVAPLDQVEQYMPHAATPNGKTVFHFRKIGDISEQFLDVSVPPSWAGNESECGIIRVDLHVEHKSVREAVLASIPENYEDLDDPFVQEWERMQSSQAANAIAAFQPFALIVRINPVPDEDRVINRHIRCVFRG